MRRSCYNYLKYLSISMHFICSYYESYTMQYIYSLQFIPWNLLHTLHSIHFILYILFCALRILWISCYRSDPIIYLMPFTFWILFAILICKSFYASGYMHPKVHTIIHSSCCHSWLLALSLYIYCTMFLYLFCLVTIFPCH